MGAPALNTQEDTVGYEFDYEAVNQKQDTMIPKFHMRSVQDKKASEAAGHPIFVDVEYVQIMSPGGSKCVPDVRVLDKHRRRWSKQYEAFKEGREAPLEGFPLAEWPQATQGIVDTLLHIHIRTVEELAAATDDGLMQLGPTFVNLKYKATDFLKSARSADAKVNALREQNEVLMKRLEALEADKANGKPKKKKTRKPLTEEQKQKRRESLAKARAVAKANRDAKAAAKE